MKLSQYTRKLIADPDSLSEADIADALDLILHSEDATDVEVAGFLTAARATHRDHKEDFIAAAVANLLEASMKFQLDDAVREQHTFLDIVGTGGDGKDTFNVSTTSAIVVAGTGAVRVAKHGGPASTSASGASDLLSHLDVDLSRVTHETAPALLQANSFTYMNGPVFHPILARVKPVRKQLGIPTIFNLVGPLLNPAPISARVLGVYTPSLGRTYAEVARRLFPGKPALVVCGAEGLDEVSPAGETYLWHLLPDGTIQESVISPLDFGIPLHPLSEVAGGTPAQNAELVRQLVDNKLPAHHPIRDYVLLNSAALLYASGAVQEFKDGVAAADASITSGGAKEALRAFVAAVSSL